MHCIGYNTRGVTVAAGRTIGTHELKNLKYRKFTDFYCHVKSLLSEKSMNLYTFSLPIPSSEVRSVQALLQG